MAAELLLVNPRRKRRRAKASGSSRKRRRRVISLARNPRKRRRRAMSALQRRYFGGGKRRRKSGGVTVMARNPRRRSRKKFSIFRRNPSPLSNPIGYAEDMAIPAISGAVGGLAIDYMFNNVAALGNLSPMANNIARLVAGALLGVGVGMATTQKIGALVAGGAITITAYDIAAQYLSNSGSMFAPNYGMGRHVMNGQRRLGKMKGPRQRRMGWWSPARTGMSGMGRHVMNGNVGRYIP